MILQKIRNMKKFLSTLVLTLVAFFANAMSYEEAREQARFLTDKMAYELNLNEAQYNDCYEINLDYLMNVQTADDIYGPYLTYRNADIRHILYDWQYAIFAAADYFFHPVYWRHAAWVFPIYRYYSVGHFYYSHPRVYFEYRGGHGRYYHRTGFYVSRRPHWTGGFRGADRGPIIEHRGGYAHHGGRGSVVVPNHHGGRGYHFESNHHQGQRGGGYTGNQRGDHSDNQRGGYTNNQNGGSSDSHHGSATELRPSVSTSSASVGRSSGYTGNQRGGSSYQHPSSTRSVNAASVSSSRGISTSARSSAGSVRGTSSRGGRGRGR